MIAIGLAIDLHTRFQGLSNIGTSYCCHQGGHPVGVGHDVIDDGARRNFAGPTHHRRHPEAALPVGVLFTAERGDTSVGPGVEVWAVVCGVEHYGVFRDAEIVQLVEQVTDHPVMSNHRVVIKPLPGETHFIIRGMGPEMHAGGIYPDKKRFVVGHCPGDEILGRGHELAVYGFHTFFGQGTTVLNTAIGKGSNDAPGAKARRESRVFGVVAVLGLLFRIQVIEVAKKLIKAVLGG